MALDMGGLNSAYQNILGRSIGAEGANFYMNSGKSLDQIKADLGASQEGQQYAGGQQQRYVAPTSQVTGLNYAAAPVQQNVGRGELNTAYQNYLGRDVGSPGADFYMNSGKSMDEIRADLAYSPEGQGYSRQQALPQIGLSGSERALTQGLGGATDAIMQGTMQGRQDLQQGLGQANQSFNQGVAGLNPFSQGGQQAQQVQLAQSGALGPEAQAQAYQNFQSSPGQDWLREQGERGVTRNAGALGGLGGGNVMKELSRFNQGLASQDFGNQFNRLGSLSGQGLTAATNIGSLRGQQGNMQMNAATNMSGLAQGAGNLIGQNVMNTGINLSTGRTQAGRDIAGNVQDTTSALSDLINQQGSGLADIIGSGANAAANTITGLASQLGISEENLATILGNLATGQGTQLSGLEGNYGQGQAYGIQQGANALHDTAMDAGKAIFGAS